MDTPKVLVDAFSHHLDGLMTTLSKIVSDGTSFRKYVDSEHYARFLELRSVLVLIVTSL